MNRKIKAATMLSLVEMIEENLKEIKLQAIALKLGLTDRVNISPLSKEILALMASEVYKDIP